MSKFSTFTEMIERTVSEILKGVGTSIPGHVLAFNDQLAEVQVGIRFIDVKGQGFEIAPIVNVPVHFPGGSYSLEYQIDEGCEGVILISQRCIDAWKEQGGVADQTVLRKLDMQDAIFIPGVRSKPNKLASFQNNGIRLRDSGGGNYVWLKNNGDVSISCSNFDISCAGFNVNSSTFTHNSTNVGDTHTHPQENDSGGNTEQDTGGPQ